MTASLPFMSIFNIDLQMNNTAMSNGCNTNVAIQLTDDINITL